MATTFSLVVIFVPVSFWRARAVWDDVLGIVGQAQIGRREGVLLRVMDPDRLVEALAQRRSGVDVVLALHDNHDDVSRVVEHDGIGFHTGMQDTRIPGRVTPPEYP